MTPYDARLSRVIAALFNGAGITRVRRIEVLIFKVKLPGSVQIRKARCAMALTRGTDDPTMNCVEAVLHIVHKEPPPHRYEPPITVETRVPWPDDREDKWMGQDGGIEE